MHKGTTIPCGLYPAGTGEEPGEVLHSTLGDTRETSDKYLPVLPMNVGSWPEFPELLSSC